MALIGEMVRVPSIIKNRLKKLKIIDEEPYYKVIERLLNIYEHDNKIFEQSLNEIKSNKLKILDSKQLNK